MGKNNYINTKELFINWIEKNKLKMTTPIELADLIEDVFRSCLNLDVWSINDYKTYSDLRNKIILDKGFKKKNKKGYNIFVAEGKYYQTYLKINFTSENVKENVAIQDVMKENTNECTVVETKNVFELDNYEKKYIYDFFKSIQLTQIFYSLFQKALEQNANLRLDVRVSIIGVKLDGERLRFYSDKNGLLRFSKINKSYELDSDTFNFDYACQSIKEVNSFFDTYSDEIRLQDAENEQTKYVHHDVFGFGVIVSVNDDHDILTIKFDSITKEKNIKANHPSVSIITREEYECRKVSLINSDEKIKATRVGWDKFEAALLIEAFWKIEEKKGNRSEVLTKLSNDLRKRAINNGNTIDDTFRNLNGMSIQIANIALSFYPERSAMHRTAMFDNIASIYKNNREEFNKILKEAHRQVDGNNESLEAHNTNKTFSMTISEVDFYSYIMEEYAEKHKYDGKAYRASHHAQRCIDTVRSINEKLKESTMIQNLYSATTLKDVHWVMSFMKSKVVDLPDEETKWIWYVISRYKTFIAINENKITDIQTKLTTSQDSDQTFYIKTKSGINAAMIIENGKYKILSGSDYSLEPGISFSSTLKNEKMQMISLGIIANGKFIKDYIFNSPSTAAMFILGHSANGKVEWKTENGKLLGDITSSNLIITKPTEVKEQIIMTAEERINKYPDYVQVLKEYFPDGFAYENAIRKKKFIRAYEELNKKEFQDSEVQYKEKLMTIGFVSEEKVYLPFIVSIETRDEINCYIKKNLNTSVIYYSAIYDTFKYKLNADFSEDMLKKYLNYAFAEKYKFESEYIAKKGAIVDLKQELIKIFANVGGPMDVEEVYSKLPNVAQYVIDEHLRDKDFVVNYRGKSYFHKDVFEIDNEQLEEIRNYLNDTIQEKEQVTGNELYFFITENIPKLLELNPDVLELGFKNIIKLLLSDEFNFKGDIISSYGKQIDVRALYQDFCRKREKFNFEELEIFRDSINQSYIDYNGVFEVSIRVNEDTFIRRDLLDFDVQKIDEAILCFCTGKYMSYLDIINFHDFPNTSYPWNKYLLEGYLFLNSQKFGILNAAFNKKKPVGAIIFKNAFDNFDELLVEVMKDNKLFNKEKAFEYLQENDYILTKKIKNIDLLINKAKN